MTQITEAIYTHGVLKPTGELDLREDQRVRVIVESLDGQLGARYSIASISSSVRI